MRVCVCVRVCRWVTNDPLAAAGPPKTRRGGGEKESPCGNESHDPEDLGRGPVAWDSAADASQTEK